MFNRQNLGRWVGQSGLGVGRDKRSLCREGFHHHHLIKCNQGGRIRNKTLSVAGWGYTACRLPNTCQAIVPAMKHQRSQVNIGRFVAVAVVMTIVALFVTLIMFSGLTGPVGFILWMIICWPMPIMDHYVWNLHRSPLLLEDLIGGLFRALCDELLQLVAPDRRE